MMLWTQQFTNTIDIYINKNLDFIVMAFKDLGPLVVYPLVDI